MAHCTVRLSALRPLMAVVSLVFFAGCGGKGTYPVEGKVVYPDGTVATDLGGHTVNFESSELKVSATGDVQPDGTFTVGTYDYDDGALPGKYKVSVMRPLPVSDEPVPRDVINPKFYALGTSGLEVTIEPKTNEVTLQVERVKRP